jgi:AcrR family transcriptional regulator
VPNSLERRHNRRRRHERTRQELIAAALGQAVAGSFKDLTVEGVTREAGVSRSAFYVYFGDKEELLLGALEDLIADHRERLGKCWADGLDPSAALSRGLLEVARIYDANRDLLTLTFETATYDEEVRDLWTAVLDEVIESTADRIRSLQGAGSVDARLDASALADGLVLMTERSFQVNLARGGQSPDQAAASVAAVWTAALFGPGDPAPQAGAREGEAGTG